jgi:hypothetical protein
MKKIFALIALVASTSTFADSATVEYQNVNTLGGLDSKAVALAVKHDFNNVFAGDVQISNTQTNQTNALSTRLETGLTGVVPLTNTVKGYVRSAVGQKFTNTVASGYYSIEPGVSMPVGPVTAKVGVRFRQATSDTVADTTRTVRAGLTYALTKQDSVTLRFDRVRGDNTQNITALAYSHSF